MSDITKDHNEASLKLNEVWKLDRDKVEKMQTDFMKEVKGMMWHLSQEEDFMASAYEADMVLDTLQNLVDRFRDVYHIVSVTSGWHEDYERIIK